MPARPRLPGVERLWSPFHDPRETWTGVPGRLALASVQACEQGRGAMFVRRHGQTRWTVCPPRCGCWRCRRCGPYVDARLLDRLRSSIGGWRWGLYLVLTIDPKSGDEWSAYKLAGEWWDGKFRKRILRKFGDVEYVATVERHVSRSKHPHLNVLLRGEGLRFASDSAERPARARGKRERGGRGWEWRYVSDASHGRGRECRFSYLRPWFDEHAHASGFGVRTWVEVVVGAHGLDEYFVAAARDLGSARFKRGDQTPIGAPPHTRRIRASEGILPEPSGGGGGVEVVVAYDVDVATVPTMAHGDELVVDPAFVERVKLAAARRADLRSMGAPRRSRREPLYELGPTVAPWSGPMEAPFWEPGFYEP